MKTRYTAAALLWLTAALLWLTAALPAAAQGTDRPGDTLYQVSTLTALLAGDYDGRTDFRSLMQQGDFGLGTFDALDGEMVAVDGTFYQVRADGIATVVDPAQLTPFAAVTRFHAEDVFHVSGPLGCTALFAALQARLPSDQVSYAIRVSGHFASLQTRSEPAQQKPYPPLAEVLAQQIVFEFSEVNAILAGFWMPAVVADVNVPGFHFHAIITDRMAGGHVLDCEALAVNVEIDRKQELQVRFADEAHPRPASPPQGRAPASPGQSPAVTHW